MSLLDTASLLLTPNAYKEGKLYSVIPSDGSGDFTFTRATTATRVNSDGLVELVPYNLLSYSEQFNDATWGKTNITVAANAGTAPDGTLTADRITASADSATINQLTPQTVQTYTHSVWVKAESGTVSGSIYGISSFATRTNFVATTEWQRITNTVLSLGFNRFPTIQLNNSGSSILVWAAQLVEGSNALPYQKTETRLNIPRLDYSLGGCPSILLEPQRTNLALQSSSFDSGSWGKQNASVTANSTISPSGITDADTLLANGASGIHRTFQVLNFVSGTSYTISVYAKKNTNDFFQVVLSDSAFNSSAGWANFDLNNGTIGTKGVSTNASITDVGNGWYRCSITATAVASVAETVTIVLISSSTSPRQESNTLSTSVFLWGAQLEAGSYATSYIPTTTASVTRNADVCSKTGIADLIGQTEGTLFAEIDFNSNVSGNKMLLGLASNGSNFIYFFIANSALTLSVVNSGNFEAYMTYNLPTNGKYKIAAAYKLNDFVMYANGTQVASDTSGSVPTTSILYLGNNFLSVPNKIEFDAAALWKERLSDSELATLTTL